MTGGAAKYRSRVRIWADILRTVREEGDAKPTRVLYGANLSHDRLTRYLEELEAKGLLRRSGTDAGGAGERATFAITPEGERFLGEYAKLKRFTDAFGLDL